MTRPVMIEINGISRPKKVWAKTIGIDPKIFDYRLKNGLTGRALTAKADATKIHKRHSNKPRTTARLALKKLKTCFPDTEEGFLIYSILECAVLDLFGTKELAKEAGRFLLGPMDVITAAGVDPDYVRRVLYKMGCL